MNDYVAIIYINVGHYHLARLNALAQFNPNMVVIEIVLRQNIYPWKPNKEDLPYPLESLFDRPLGQVGNKEQKKAMLRCLAKYHPTTVIVSGYSAPIMRIAATWARKKKAKDILLFSSTEIDRPRVWWRERIKSILLKRYSALAVSGKRSAQYAQKLRKSREKIYVIGNVIDNDGCQKLAKAFQANETGVRKKLELPRDFFLFVGRISREKNLPMLLKAFSTYRKSGGTWDLILVGSGPEMDNLRRESSSMRDHIHFAGWKQFGDLMAYYALARCLVLPSISETWGLVVNEAMACGLPVLVSKNCGCAPDLCKNGINGHIFDPRDGEGLASLMGYYSNGKFDLRKMGAESKTIIRNSTPQTWAHKLHKIITQ